jgi:hypothetical protein
MIPPANKRMLIISRIPEEISAQPVCDPARLPVLGNWWAEKNRIIIKFIMK